MAGVDSFKGKTVIIDLGGIQQSRSMEMMLPIWLGTYMATKNAYLGFKIVR